MINKGGPLSDENGVRCRLLKLPTRSYQYFLLLCIGYGNWAAFRQPVFQFFLLPFLCLPTKNERYLPLMNVIMNLVYVGFKNACICLLVFCFVLFCLFFV